MKAGEIAPEARGLQHSSVGYVCAAGDSRGISSADCQSCSSSRRCSSSARQQSESRLPRSLPKTPCLQPEVKLDAQSPWATLNSTARFCPRVRSILADAFSLPLAPKLPPAVSCPLLFISCLQQVGLEDSLNSIMLLFYGKYVAREHCFRSSSKSMRPSKTQIAVACGARGVCGSRRCKAGLRD